MERDRERKILERGSGFFGFGVVVPNLSTKKKRIHRILELHPKGGRKGHDNYKRTLLLIRAECNQI